MGKGGLVEFRPARRVFAGRGRSMLTFGEWKIAIGGMIFGAAVSAGWFADLPTDFSPLTRRALLAQAEPAEVAPPPPAKPVLAGPAPAKPVPAEPVKFASLATDSETPTVEEAPVEEAPPDVAPAPDEETDALADPPSDLEGRVARVVDGDTFYLEGLSTSIRLWGVDAPERDEYGFDEATKTLSALVEGQKLACAHVDTDKYNRIVARCYLGDGADLSEAMIKSGAADEYLIFTQGYYGGE